MPVWEDVFDTRIDRYYVSPEWYIPQHLSEFLAEYEWNGKKGEYWEQNSRYSEALREFEYWLSWYKSGKNKGG